MTGIPHGAIFETCYVTHDLERAIARWGAGVGAGPFYVMEMPVEFGTKIYRGKPAQDSFKAALGFSGMSLIEFIQPTNDAPSVFREVLDTKGDMAVHHIMPSTKPLTPAEYDALYNKYVGLGYVDAINMVLPGLGRNSLFDARKQLGVFIELLEVSADMYRSVENMQKAHATWDGTRPIREFMESMA